MAAVGDGLVKGLHHITLVTASERVNRRFYTEVLGLRRVKLSVNQDDIFHRHLFYGDERGSSGSVVTFFEWPHLVRGHPGLGSPHHLAYSVKDVEALLKWSSWLKRNGLRVSGPHIVGDRVSIYFRDPDGFLLELASRIEGGIDDAALREMFVEEVDVDGITQDMRLSLMDHASPLATDAAQLERFLSKTLGLKMVSKRENPHDSQAVILGFGCEDHDFLRYILKPSIRAGFVGIGSIHHIAVKVESDEDQKKVMQTLDSVGIRHSGIIDRFWFKSLYFRDPFGNLLEVATTGPGYTVDEAPGVAWLQTSSSTMARAREEKD
ncbi:Putative ring-cleaving dioxygenase MhqA [Candidatus Calditenuaceae archaeon HR02]|nr:Putative ring-cleaving dioxygenase MhqA [Candidatus Calditenuaceae archaeon HR02]